MILNKKYSTWKTFSRLWEMILPFKFGFNIAIFSLIINAISDTLMLSLLKPLLDEGFRKNNNIMLKWLPIIICSLVLIRGISSFMSNYFIGLVSGKVVMTMRRKLFRHIIRMPVSFFDQQSIGSLVSRITYDSDQVSSSAANALIIIVRESAYIVGLFLLMFYYSWKISIILIMIASFTIFNIYFISRYFRNISKEMQTGMGLINSSVERILKGYKEVLMFGKQKFEEQRFNKISDYMRRKTIKIIVVSSIADPAIQFFASIALGFTIYIMSFPSFFQELSAGSAGVILSGMFALMRPLKSLSNINVQFQQGIAACQTLFSILDLQKEKDEGKKLLKTIRKKIEFKNVNFKYPTKTHHILYNLSFKISAGKSFALLGRSGSGKSTITNLISRFYDINNGEILFDNYNIREYSLKSLRNQITLISQNIYLFNDTIANNIAYAGSRPYQRKEIKQAAKMAHAIDFIENFNNGFDTIIGENGTMLSGGQKKKIAIARALLRNSSVLILDEPTSGLDIESEKDIQFILRELQKNCTSIIITHQLSIAKQADKIFFIQNGNILEQGTHKFLIKRNGEYARFYNMQFKKENQ